MFMASIGASLKHFVSPLAREMQRMGYETLGVAGDMVPMDGFNSLHELPAFRRRGLRGVFRAQGRLRQLLRDHRPTLLYVQTPPALVLGRLAARSARIPSVAAVHGTFLEPFGLRTLIYASLEAILARLSSVTVCVNEEDAGFYRRVGAASMVLMAPVGGIGLDFSRLSPAAARPVRIAPWPAIVVVGRLTSDKNLDRVVDAFRIVQRGEPRASLTFIGSPMPGDHPWVVPVGRGIFHLSWLADPYRYIAGADLMVSASRREGFPMALAEALALGVPVVAVSNRGTRQLQRSGPSGLILTTPQPRLLALAMEETLARFANKQIEVKPGPHWSQETALNFYQQAIELALDRGVTR